jgi:acyl-CoA synthetase (AMP-forming)/AMP-acid ligase II
MYLLCRGEVFSRDLLMRLQAQRGACAIINHYGPTETTVGSLLSRVEEPGTVTVGRPVANTDIFILDEYLQLLPFGAPGELYIGGNGVARGYLRQPMQTAERFIAHPFSPCPGARLYRTEDRMCFLCDGLVEFLRYIDLQVKIRSFRVEAGEMEIVLRQHPAVGDAVVVARSDDAGLAHLVAYVVPRLSRGPDCTSSSMQCPCFILMPTRPTISLDVPYLVKETVKEVNQKGTREMTTTRKQYDPAFTFNVVMESFQRETTLEEVSRKCEVSSCMLSRWRQAFQQRGAEIFPDQRDPKSRSKAQGDEPGASPDDRKKRIGELTVQNEI